ncbi:MAG: hypothetical protein HY707_05335 [Ignavibacteriae bacterium]|nr:hypothetical protein [Ignavibacteriota bacterium]
MRRLTYLLLLCVVPWAFAQSEIIKSGSFQASSDGINVTLHWITEDETNVARFEIERRTGTEGEFMSIGSVGVKGPSLYEFVDYSALNKAVTLYQYRIKIIFSNGANPIYTTTLTVSHTVSGVRRTWGSIKAMFR